MREQVNKYAVPLTPGDINIRMHVGASVVQFAYMDNVPWVWALEDGEAEYEDKLLYLARSGQDLPNGDAFHVGTAVPQLSAGSEVWHLFEEF